MPCSAYVYSPRSSSFSQPVVRVFKDGAQEAWLIRFPMACAQGALRRPIRTWGLRCLSRKGSMEPAPAVYKTILCRTQFFASAPEIPKQRRSESPAIQMCILSIPPRAGNKAHSYYYTEIIIVENIHSFEFNFFLVYSEDLSYELVTYRCL